MEEKT